MKSLSKAGLGLTVVFGCLFFALLCEIYYLLWWKRRVTGRINIQDDDGDLFYLSCLKKMKTNKKTPCCSSSLISKPSNENDVETVLNVGPSRFLFTIIEETKEDLESENGNSKEESRKLSDLMRSGDTNSPYMTPIPSPTFFTPPLTPSMGSSSLSRSSSNGYNPFYESSTNVEINKMIRSTSSSPPPLFKFLRDAEDKLQRKNTLQSQEVLPLEQPSRADIHLIRISDPTQ